MRQGDWAQRGEKRKGRTAPRPARPIHIWRDGRESLPSCLWCKPRHERQFLAFRHFDLRRSVITLAKPRNVKHGHVHYAQASATRRREPGGCAKPPLGTRQSTLCWLTQGQLACAKELGAAPPVP